MHILSSPRFARITALVLIFAMVFSLGACGKKNAPVQGDTDMTPVTVTREAEPPAVQTASEATTLALRQYIYARLATEALASVDLQTVSGDAFLKLADEAVLAWEGTLQTTAKAEGITAQALSQLEAAAASSALASARPQMQFMSLSAETEVPSMVLLSSSSSTKVDAQTWAENLTKQYDAIKGAKRYKQLAEQLGTDAKSAYEQMVLAQKILQNAAALEEAEAESAEYNRCLTLVQKYKTASKVGVFVTATISTGGGTLTALSGSSFTAAQTAGTIVGGVDCIVDIADTGSNILLGEDNQVSATATEVKKYLGPVSSVMGIANWGDAANGEKLSYIGDSLTDWYFDGKVLGVTVIAEKDGSAKLTAQLINNVGEAGLKLALKAAGLVFPQTTRTLQQVMDHEKPDITVSIARLDALATKMAELSASAGSAESTPSAPAGSSNVSGRYVGTSQVRSVDSSGNTIEQQEPKSYTFIIREEAGKVFFHREGYEDTVKELRYDAQKGIALLEEGESTMEFTFDLSASPVKANGTIKMPSDGGAVVFTYTASREQ